MMPTVDLAHYPPSPNSLLGKNEEVRKEDRDTLTISGKYEQKMNTPNQAKHQTNCI